MVKTVKPATPRVLKPVKAAKPDNPLPPPDNGPDMETFHYHLGQIIAKNATIAAHRKDLKKVRRAAVDAGLNLADMDTILKMREEEPETVQDGIRRLARYAEWAGLAPGVQGDLFKHAGKKIDEIERAEHEGYQDGLEGLTAEGDRYDPASEAGQARLKGWNRGQQVIRDRFLAQQPQAGEGETVQ